MDNLSLSTIAQKYGSIDKIRQDIKRKLNTIRTGEADAQVTLKKVFKPLTDPLAALQKTVSSSSSTPALVAAPQEKKTKIEASKSETKDGTTFVDSLFASFGSPKNINNDDDEDDDSKEDDDDDDDDESFQDATGKEQTTSRTEDDDVDSRNTITAPHVQFYLDDLEKQPKQSDTTYGVRKAINGNYLIGNRTISFDSDGRLILDGGDEVFEPTPGFLELIFKKHPRNYTADDRANFQRVVTLTNAHWRNHHPHGRPNSNRSQKYRDLIKPLFATSTPRSTRKSSRKKLKKGSGMKIHRAKRELVYWDDPNELVQRLVLLVASKQAGHTDHDREILSIVEELREADYIH